MRRVGSFVLLILTLSDLAPTFHPGLGPVQAHKTIQEEEEVLDSDSLHQNLDNLEDMIASSEYGGDELEGLGGKGEESEEI
mmetsp:Transcript_8631/g.14604  ORF Transcript_8631/g.14604 Transcript_8631/m.14604 type:complete len:81 (+) Transcript_8631:41-283(+)